MRIPLLLLGLPLLLGCTVVTIKAPITVSTKPLPELANVSAGKEVRGRSCARVVLMIIPIGYSSADAAYQDALDAAPGADTILRYETRLTDVFFSPLYSQFCTEIHGYAVSSQQLFGGSHAAE